jgi:hypothetical protein
MNDVHLIISLKRKAKKRRSNFLLLNVLDELEKYARESPLELPILQRLQSMCQVYHVAFDDDELACLSLPRPKHTGKIRLSNLRKLGLGVEL